MNRPRKIGQRTMAHARKADLRWQRKAAQKRMNDFSVYFIRGSILPRFDSAANKMDVAIANRKKGG